MCGWDATAVPANEWTIEVDGDIPSQSALGGNVKSGYKYRNIRKALERTLGPQLNKVPRANKFRSAIVTRLYGKTSKGVWKRPYDVGNLVGGCKPLIDTLTNFAVILDDRDSCFRGYYKQERNPDGVDRIRLQILEYE